MTPNAPAAYDQLTPEEAAHIDTVCDRFERVWKAVKAGGPVPRLASYLGHGRGLAREVLFQELTALDWACRQRYGFAVRPEESKQLSAEALTTPAFRPADWPSIPGLELVGVLGSGGMGVVFKARQATLDRDVAVKFLRDDHRADPGQRERFHQEARTVARLRHPHLVQVYEFGELPAAGGATSRPYLVLEYMAGGNLADLLRGAPQPPREAARLVETLAVAIHYAHRQGVIHRDLKPANVLLQKSEIRNPKSESNPTCEFSNFEFRISNFTPKVTDFGLAKFPAASDLTHSGDVLGTPSYMAPEQAAGKSVPITAAVDVYGLGAILYETLTGRPPFAAATVDATLAQVRQDEPVPPRRLQPTVPRDLETICLKCLRKEAGRRYASALDLADDLRRFRAGEPVRARPVGTVERLVGWCRRQPRIAGLLAALVLVFLAGSAGVLWQWQRASRNAAAAGENAAAFRQQRDTARREKERAEHHLQMIRHRVDRLNRLGRDLLHRPRQYRTGQAVLEEALAFYREVLPEEGNDLRLRWEAAALFRLVADIHFTLGQLEPAAEAYRRQASLLTSLLEEEPASKTLRLALADSHRWQGNLLRDLGKSREAQAAYDRATGLHEGLLRESPDDAGYQAALANTLLNTATLLLSRDQAEALGALYRRVIELDRAAVRAAPRSPNFHAELALALADQGQFFLDTGRNSEAEAALREALAIHQKLLAGGYLKGYVERYAARNFVRLARVQEAAGQARQAEESYQKAVSLLERFVKQWPESALGWADLAKTLAGQADLLKDPGRLPDVEKIRRQVIRHYETLKADFPEDPQYRLYLVQSYLKLVNLLWELGRPAEAVEPYRKAFALDPEDPDINNELAWFLATNPVPCLRDAARAVRLAQKAVTARPHSGDYRNTLAVAHYGNGDDRAAVAELETAMRQRAGGDSFDWFFLAMAHGRLGNQDQARTWFDRAVPWMDRYQPQDDELRRFRAEAEAVLAEAGRR